MNAQQQTDTWHLDVYNRYSVTLVRGEGSRVWDREGRSYLDALAGIAVNSVGHCHPKVVEAIREQAGRLIHISNFYYSEPQGELVERIARLSGMDRVFLCNSGAEAMEASLKLARRHANSRGKKGRFITLGNAFHGRTIATISMGMEKYADGYDPLLGGFHSIPLNDIAALEEAVDDQTPGVILETVQGSGGLHTVSDAFMDAVAALQREHGLLLIVDEVQTGIGRTGRMFGFRHYGVQPDIIAMAKAMGGGFPVGAMAARQEVAEAMSHGDHGSTYGGNPLACAAANAALQVVTEEHLDEQAAEKGEYLRSLIEEGLSGTGHLREIRGRGLMIGVELGRPCRPVVEKMLRRGVLSNGTQGNVIRLVPPLVITREELDLLAEVLTDAVAASAPAS